MRHLVERNPAYPLVRIVAAADRQAAIARRPDRHAPRRLISDVAIDIAVHHVLSGRAETRERLPKLLPVLGGVRVEEHQSHAVLQRPAQGNLARLARKQFGNDRSVPRGNHVERHIRLSFDANRFLPVLRIDPSCRSLVLPLRIELLDEVVFHSRPNVGESPADALVVAHNNEWNSRQRNAGNVEVAGLSVLSLLLCAGPVVVFRCASNHKFGIWWSRCISFDSSGFPETVCSPETAQLFDPARKNIGFFSIGVGGRAFPC